MSRELFNRAVRYARDRRTFLLSGGSLAVLPWVSQIGFGQTITKPSFAKDPFQIGIASGDPTPDGFVLWTRLAMDPVAVNGGMDDRDYEVTWEISDDESFSKVLRSGKSLATAKLGHSVHVEVEGLSPDRWYAYRFQCGDAISLVGRARTTPPRCDA